jgi:hypothetical protein
MTSVLTAASLGLVVLQIGVTVWLVKALRTVRTLDERVAHLGDAMALLSETAESGFRAVATEVERLRVAQPRRHDARTTARIATAARRGRTLQEIAATEQVSEGEVRLRLHFADPPAGAAEAHATPPPAPSARTRAARSKANGAVRS